LLLSLLEGRADFFDHPIDQSPDDPGIAFGLEGNQVTLQACGPRATILGEPYSIVGGERPMLTQE
jgi:hypothetical protein